MGDNRMDLKGTTSVDGLVVVVVEAGVEVGERWFSDWEADRFSFAFVPLR